MALEKNIILDVGLEVRNAYIRIDTVSGYKGSIEISVNTYVSRESFLKGTGYLTQNLFVFTPSVDVGSKNFIKQGYDYLKTLSEFENAVNIPSDGSPD